MQIMSIEELFEKLKEAIREKDPEYIHSAYDEIIYQLAKKQDEDTVKKLDRLVDGWPKWYA